MGNTNAGPHGVTPEGLKDRKALGFYKEAVAELEGASGVARNRWRLKEWKPVYTKVLVLHQKGMSVAQIAAMAEIGFSARQLQAIIRDPLFRLKLSQYNKKLDVAIIEKAAEEMAQFPEVVLARDKLLESSERAAEILVKLLRPRGHYAKMSINERRLILSVCQDILDRAGLKIAKSEEAAPQRSYSPEELSSALANAKELEAIANRLQGQGSRFVLGTAGTSPTDEPTPDPCFSIKTTSPGAPDEATTALPSPTTEEEHDSPRVSRDTNSPEDA